MRETKCTHHLWLFEDQLNFKIYFLCIKHIHIYFKAHMYCYFITSYRLFNRYVNIMVFFITFCSQGIPILSFQRDSTSLRKLAWPPRQNFRLRQGTNHRTGRRAQDDDDRRATLFTSNMAATEMQQPFKAAIDCLLNKLEGKFTLKIEQQLALNDFSFIKRVCLRCFLQALNTSLSIVDMIGWKFVQQLTLIPPQIRQNEQLLARPYLTCGRVQCQPDQSVSGVVE